MKVLLEDIRHQPLLWLLAAMPVVFIVREGRPDAHTLLFVLSVLAIVPLAILLSRATEFVAARTGDAVGGLLNATLGNLTELVIALAALRAGEYALVKASIAGAIVTNSLFMLGASFLLGGLTHHFQEYNRVNARIQAGLLFLASVALIIPSAVSHADVTSDAEVTGKLSVGLAILLIAVYGLGLLFSLRTHREWFASAETGEAHEGTWPLATALATLVVVTIAVALTSEIFVELGAEGSGDARNDACVCGFHHRGTRGRGGGNDRSILCGSKKPPGPKCQYRDGERIADRAFRGAGADTVELRLRPVADGPQVLAWCRHHDTHSHHDGIPRDNERAFRLVHWRPHPDGLSDLRPNALSAPASGRLSSLGSGARGGCPTQR